MKKLGRMQRANATLKESFFREMLYRELADLNLLGTGIVEVTDTEIVVVNIVPQRLGRIGLNGLCVKPGQQSGVIDPESPKPVNPVSVALALKALELINRNLSMNPPVVTPIRLVDKPEGSGMPNAIC